MFKPNFTITSKINNALIEIERLRHEISDLPITPSLLTSLRESARLSSVHYSTMIEGNRLTEEEIFQTIKEGKKLQGRTRDQNEALGYYTALDEIALMLRQQQPVTEDMIKKIHALVMGAGAKKIAPTPYRTQQNAIYESGTRRLVYLPPEAKDVPMLMKDLVVWLHANPEKLAGPLVAGITHYQYATIHPYIDGNGRTARLLTTYLMHLSGYDLKGIYSLDEYYAKNLAAYYQAISIGPSHNYYMGRAEADITPWVEYFCLGIVESFTNVKRQALKEMKQGVKDLSSGLRKLDPRQRIALTLFEKQEVITALDIAKLFNLKARTARLICQQWVEKGFLIIIDPAKKSRKYGLAPDLSRQMGYE